jgi:hypothetical protein
MTKYIIKDIEEGLYYGGYNYGWCDRMRMAETFETKQDAERFANNENDGWYKIEEVYIVES